MAITIIKIPLIILSSSFSYILYIKNASAIHLDNKGEISAVPLCVVISITNSRMPSAFLLRDARHAMHDIFFCASLQSCRSRFPSDITLQTAATNIYGVDSLFFWRGSLASGKLKVMLLYQFVPAIRHILPCLQLH